MSKAIRKSFNPRTPCGVRPPAKNNHVQTLRFNPRTPCGVRLGRLRGLFQGRRFNPRTPCGVRPTIRARPND